jgi:hypothetical protein
MQKQSGIESIEEIFSLSGKGLFVFSDPGGAKPVLAIVDIFKDQLEYQILSDRVYKFYDDFGLIINKASRDPDDYISEFKPDFLFTGTSYSSSIELTFLKSAKKKGILTYSYVDHYTSIIERFIHKGELVLPDTILLPDSTAYEIAVKREISETRLKVIGNPYLKFIQKWLPKIDRRNFFSSIQQEYTDKKIILYAPDPLSNVSGKEKFGFDEIAPTKSINEVAFELRKECIFVFKPHPNQSLDSLSPDFYSNMVLIDKMYDTNTLIYYSDTVIGFISNILIEALELNKRVIRFIPSEIINDPLIHYTQMLIINNPKNLAYELSK